MDEEQVRQLLHRLTDRARAAFAVLRRAARRLAAPLWALWARFAIRRWEQVQRVFAEHRDLVDYDRWLDRWYSFGTV